MLMKYVTANITHFRQISMSYLEIKLVDKLALSLDVMLKAKTH